MKRGRNQRRRQGMNINRALDSNGPDVRIRGTASQIYDKYLALARDANSSGDRVKAENYLQHAEHYFRMIRALQPQAQLQGANGEAADGEFDGPSSGEDRRFQRDPARSEQPQPSFTSDDDDDDVAPPPSRFDAPPSFLEERGEPQPSRSEERYNGRQDGGHREPRQNSRSEMRDGTRRDGNRQDSGRRDEHREGGEPRSEGEGSEARFDGDRRGRRRRRPRPPLTPGEAPAEPQADGGQDDVVAETV